VSTDASSNGNTAFTNETPEAERRQIVKDDARKLPQPGERGDCYMRRAASMIGSELGGRFQRLAEQQIVGQSATPYPAQPANSPFASNPVPTEPPLGIDVGAVKDTSKVNP
jgi:hypothetical protein